MNKNILDRFLSNYPRLQDGETINFDSYKRVIDNAKSWHGAEFAKFLAGCFIPSGGRVCPGYEDRISDYTFDYPEFDNE